MIALTLRRLATNESAAVFSSAAWALVASVLIVAAAGHVFYHHRRQGELVRPAILLLILLTVQITLGACTVLTAKHYIINSLHVVTGATVLATSLVLTLRAHRARFTARAAVGRMPPESTSIEGEPTRHVPRGHGVIEGGRA